LTVALGRALPDTPLAAIRTDLDASDRGLHMLAGRLVPTPGARVVVGDTPYHKTCPDAP
jgi:hypothetical protein